MLQQNKNIKNIKIRINNALFHSLILHAGIVSLLFHFKFHIRSIVKKLMLCNYNISPRSDEMGSAFNFRFALQYICRNFALISE